MARTGRPGFSTDEKNEVWLRWRSGESISDIGRAIDKAPGSVFGVLKLNGGITPRARYRSSLSISLSEREEISRGIASGNSIRQISRSLGRSPSTVSREIKRHGGLNHYRAVKADEKAWDFARRPKRCKLANHPELRGIVSEKLFLQWSPEQISGWLKNNYPKDDFMQVSHETIYRSLFIKSRGVLNKELIKNLRSGRKMRQSKYYNTKGITRGQIIEGISIHERPKDINDRSVSGHWEGDLISGSNNTHIATLVERKSRFTVLVKVEGKDTKSVTNALSKKILDLPENLRKSLTWDRGMELANHKELSMATNVKVYFCDPKSPWQRGTNENTNRLLRQYFPKKTDLSIYSQEKLDFISDRLNQRPRKVIGFSIPMDKFWECVALTN